MKLLIYFSFIFLMDCNFRNDPPKKVMVVPIYLSYSELRSPLVIDHSKTLNKSGKIYLYKDYLFVNEPNQGIHVFNNVDNTNPISLGFITIPGNIDISIKDDILYADSFIDLLAIDISNINDVKITKRIKNAFRYNAYQMIDGNSFEIIKIDIEKGVIIGIEGKI